MAKRPNKPSSHHVVPHEGGWAVKRGGASSAKQPFRILSIDGGGLRGVLPAHVLALVEQDLSCSLHEEFDMFAGTSTGAIIAAGVAVGKSAADIRDLYRERGEEVFCEKKSRAERWRGSEYGAAPLKKLLQDAFGAATLGDVEKPLLLPAADIGNGVVHVLKSPYSKEFVRDRKVPLWEAVSASCSAPLKFDPHTLDRYLLADGALWANNPSLAATIDAKRRLGVALDDIRVLTLGTGQGKVEYGTDQSRKWGLASGWEGMKFAGLIASLQGQSTHNYLSLLLDEGQCLRIDFPASAPLPMDDPSRINDFISKADHWYAHNGAEVRAWLTTQEITHEQ